MILENLCNWLFDNCDHEWEFMNNLNTFYEDAHGNRSKVPIHMYKIYECGKCKKIKRIKVF